MGFAQKDLSPKRSGTGKTDRLLVDPAALDSLDDPPLEDKEHTQQRQDRDRGGHEQLVQVAGLLGEEGRQGDLHGPRVLVLPDDQRP